MGDSEDQLKRQLENLPKELRNCGRWVHWRLEDTPPKNGKPGRERCKVPKIVGKPRGADSTDPDTWVTFEKAVAAPLPESFPKYAAEENHRGYGLVFGPPYFGVDLDKCLDPETGDVDQWAKDIIEQILPPTYFEITPSGKGFHFWYRCDDHSKLPAGHRTEKVEVYSRDRYFTMTGSKTNRSKDEITVVSLSKAVEVFQFIEGLKQKSKAAPSNTTLNKIQRTVML